MATIKDVARKANVSIASVSRVLNGNYPVSESTRKAVLDAIKETGYRVNTVAKSLKTNQSYVVGLVVPDISNPFFMSIARGLEDVIYPLGYTLNICSSDENPDKEIRLLETFGEKQVDFIVLATCQTEPEKINKFIEQGSNIIMVDTVLEGVNVTQITENNYLSSYNIVKEALSKGHRNILLVKGLELSSYIERYEGFVTALEEYGIDINSVKEIDGGFFSQKAHDEFIKLWSSDLEDKPTLIYSTNNSMTEGILLALKDLKLELAKDISLVSYGGIRLSNLFEPKLTSIKQDSKEMGTVAGEIIKDYKDSKVGLNEYRQITLESSLVKGSSVKKI